MIGLCVAFSQYTPDTLGRRCSTISTAIKEGSLSFEIHNNSLTGDSNWLQDRWWEDDYWFREDVHTLGNTGVLGGLHAALAPLSTKIIDLLAYKGKNVREVIAGQLCEGLLVRHHDATSAALRVLDLGCGVGMSTLALSSAFQQQGSLNATVIGVDTSPEMLAMARAKDFEQKGIANLSQNNCSRKRDANHTNSVDISFLEANAEATHFPRESFDFVTIQYVFHEVPFLGRHRILKEARRLLKPGGTLAIVDISPNYEPSPSMLSGEPYLKEYQANFRTQLSSLRGFASDKEEIVVPGHVILHVLTKADRWWKRNGWTRRVIEFGNLHSYVWNRLQASEYSKDP